MNKVEQKEILLLTCIVLIVIYYSNQYIFPYLKQKTPKLKKKRDLFRSKLEFLNSALEDLSRLFDFSNGFLSEHQLATWLEQHKDLFEFFNNKTYLSIGLNKNEIFLISSFNKKYTSASKERSGYNEKFIASELGLYDSFFNNVEGRKLDVQQRTAIVSDENNNLVIAGAGSGKTTTIVGKVCYVINRYKVNPEDILLISFTNKSASTLAERINIKGVEAKTFHKFGKDVIVSVEGKQPSLFDDLSTLTLLDKGFKELKKEKKFLSLINEYLGWYQKPYRSQFEFENKGEYIQYLKDYNFKRFIKEPNKRNNRTCKNDIVKSGEECQIANFLLFNGITYEYEKNYQFDTANKKFRQYKPDFTITQNGKTVYLEHFGISKDGSVPVWFNSDEGKSPTETYWAGILWKRSTHKQNNTVLIETYSYEREEGVLFDNLKKRLNEVGIVLTPLTEEEKGKIIEDNTLEELDIFFQLITTFLALMKSNNYTFSDVFEKNQLVKNREEKKRNSLFLKIFERLFSYYETYLNERKEIDFSDMINKAERYISEGLYLHKYRYIIIDEFQDISIGRYRLVKSILKKNPSCKLFCVGDDWQSIYRFTGSDITLFKDFEKFFGVTIKSKIETTYRFNNPLIKLSSDFILKNPNQTHKTLKGLSEINNTDFCIKYSVDYENKYDTKKIREIVEELINAGIEVQKKHILILGRYTFDINRLKNDEDGFFVNDENGRITINVKREKQRIL